MIFSELDSLLSVAEKLRNYFSAGGKKEELSVAGRFLRLFEAHGVHRNQIPRLLPDFLSLSDVETEQSLTKALTNEALDFSCDLFSVRRDWIDGASDQIYPLHDFYKQPSEFREFVSTIASNTKTNPLGMVLRAESEKFEDTALIILQEGVAFLGETPIYRYHICNNWMDSYWKSRAYLTACIAIAWGIDFYLSGRETDIATVRMYNEGENFLGCGANGVYSLKGARWYPEDMALVPAKYLEGINPEVENYGIRSALELWLELESNGFMKTGLPYNSVRSEFEAALSSI